MIRGAPYCPVTNPFEDRNQQVVGRRSFAEKRNLDLAKLFHIIYSENAGEMGIGEISYMLANFRQNKIANLAKTGTTFAITRESWLGGAVERFRELFKRIGCELSPNVNVCCGFPSRGALARVHRRLGQCWSPDGKPDAKFEVFVSPVIDDPIDVLGVVAHELVHIVVGNAAGHRAPFKRVALAIGLIGRMTATVPGNSLKQELICIAGELGPYPHRALEFDYRQVSKQGTRELKVVCKACGYVARITQKWIDRGLPTCPCGTKLSVALQLEIPGFSVKKETI